MRILVVEDEAKMAGLVRRVLVAERHVVDIAPDGVTAIALAEGPAYDAIVLDRMLPDIDGLSILRLWRAKGLETPVLLLTALGSVEERIAGLDAGADDYLPKPFSFAELVARLNALVRRATNVSSSETQLAYGGVVLDLLKRQATRDGAPLSLQAKELALLEYFLRSPDRVLSKTMILQRLWDYSFDPQTNVVDVLVCRLRNKIDRGYPKKLIQTLRGVGYVLRES